MMTRSADERVLWDNDDMHAAIFSAVCGLAERLTGQRMEVTVQREDGRVLRLCGDGVTWLPADPAAS
ncbi:hypothetical protein [Azospirillum sp.]|uniref:hypothetical protein n=1 Tax=Azospirillum sp. TaxID=34012 RepID=UPI003D73F3CC